MYVYTVSIIPSTLYIHSHINDAIQAFNLKVDRMRNLFTKIYNMFYYTTNLYLQ